MKSYFRGFFIGGGHRGRARGNSNEVQKTHGRSLDGAAPEPVAGTGTGTSGAAAPDSRVKAAAK